MSVTGAVNKLILIISLQKICRVFGISILAAGIKVVLILDLHIVYIKIQIDCKLF